MMYYFILLSLHVGFGAIVTGTALGARHNWARRNFGTAILGGLHCTLWSLCWAGLTIETFGGTL
jgi:hypothetical protein